MNRSVPCTPAHNQRPCWGCMPSGITPQKFRQANFFWTYLHIIGFKKCARFFKSTVVVVTMKVVDNVFISLIVLPSLLLLSSSSAAAAAVNCSAYCQSGWQVPSVNWLVSEFPVEQMCSCLECRRAAWRSTRNSPPPASWHLKLPMTPAHSQQRQYLRHTILQRDTVLHFNTISLRYILYYANILHTSNSTMNKMAIQQPDLQHS